MDEFFSFFSLQTLTDVLHAIGYPAIMLFMLIESAGIPLPGETVVLLAAFTAGVDGQLQLPWIIACASFGAIMGDNIGFYIGRTGGRRFVERFGRFFFLKTEHLDKAAKFFDRHGAKTVFFGRFITFLRIWAAFLAGMNKMRWKTFLFYNALGGIVWAVYISLLGFFAGRLLHDHFDQVELLVRMIGWAGLGICVVLVISAYVIFRIRRARRIRLAEEEAVAASHSPSSTSKDPTLIS
jgi:membrane protein DedA with SNARE-associated domain